MILNTRHFTKKIKVNLKKRYPDLFKDMTDKEINKITAYVMKNVGLSICRKKDIYLTNFFSIHINKEKMILKKLRELPEV